MMGLYKNKFYIRLCALGKALKITKMNNINLCVIGKIKIFHFYLE